MSLSTQPTRDFQGEPGGSRRDAFLMQQRIVLLLSNAAMTFGGIAIGTTVSKVTLGQAIDYCIDGRNYRKAATADLWTLVGAVVPQNSFQKYLLLLDAAGAASVVECTPSLLSAALVGFPDLFVALDNKSLVGVLTVATGVGAPFTPGTTALNAAGITATYVDGIDKLMLPVFADESGKIIKV